MIQYKTFELTFYAPEPANSQAEANLTATFVNGESRVTVRGFYAGSEVYKVRFLPQEPGHYTWRVSGVTEATGEEDCTPSPVYHGLVQTEGTHFRFEDGTQFLPFGTTVYAFAHQAPELIAQTVESLKNSPFNKVRLCLFPKHYDFNQNDPELYPFGKDVDGAWDVHRPCFAFWDRFERLLGQLEHIGIQADLILFHPYDKWGFSRLTRVQYSVYLDYLLRRFAALPNVWWSLANEYELVNAFTADDWDYIEKFIDARDPYRHLLSCHNILRFYDASHPRVTHCSLQSGEVGKTAKLLWQYKKPVLFDECGYEGDIPYSWGNLSAFEMTNRFWEVCTRGGYCTHGETFWNPEEILWWSKGGVLSGKSSERIRFLRSLLESLPGPLEPWYPSGENVYELRKNGGPKATEEKKDPFVELLRSVSDEDAEKIFEASLPCAGRYGNDAFLVYYARQCARSSKLNLPEDGEYRVEVIDAWEMTRRTVLTSAHGNVTVELPAKEGMALLAQR